MTGYPLPRVPLIRIRASENLVEMDTEDPNVPQPRWSYIDLRPCTKYYKPATLVQRGALRDLRRYGIRGNTNIKRLKFE